jgi:periplasmic protein CpxP/Spy
MSKVKLLGIVAIGLFISNLILIAFILNKPGRPAHDGPRDIIIEKLHFDKSQVDAYDELIKWHRAEIIKSDNEIRKLKNQLYSTLLSDSSSSQKDSLINELTKVHSRVETIHYKHFMDIKKLCRADQQNDYNKLTIEIASLFAPPHKNRRGK